MASANSTFDKTNCLDPGCQMSPSFAEIGDAIRHQLHALANRSDPDYAAGVAVNLEGAHRVVLRFREALMKKATP